jgi:APA family basic amino acid/polyamine antiporter
MMVSLSIDTWIRLVVWMMVGFDIYLVRGPKHSRSSENDPPEGETEIAERNVCLRTCLCALCSPFSPMYIIGLKAGCNTDLIIFNIIIAFHVVYYLWFRFVKKIYRK